MSDEKPAYILVDVKIKNDKNYDKYKKLAKRAGMSSQKKPKMAMKKAKASQTAGAIMKRERMMN